MGLGGPHSSTTSATGRACQTITKSNRLNYRTLETPWTISLKRTHGPIDGIMIDDPLHGLSSPRVLANYAPGQGKASEKDLSTRFEAELGAGVKAEYVAGVAGMWSNGLCH